MNIAEKLRFLADRAEDGKEFEINRLRYRFNNGELEVKYSWWMPSQLLFDSLISPSATLALTPNWTFTEDEKVILKNLGEKWDYIARDEAGSLYIYMEKPEKHIRGFYALSYRPFQHFNHLFQSIQWSDEEACEFREYL